jgi:hypothetical protein
MGQGRCGNITATIIALAVSCAAAAVAAEPDHEAAWKFCKRDILNQLKAPATAKFDNISLMQSKTVAETQVYFSVDAQNSYGALVRSWALCIYHPGGQKSLARMHPALQDMVLEQMDNSAAIHRPPE